jgi:UDP-glucuronate 4-epimerase
MKILVTGAAGFIGSKVAQQLAERGDEVIGLDNINAYYDVQLKYGRLHALTGVAQSPIQAGEWAQSTIYPNYRFTSLNIEDNYTLQHLFETEKFDRVCHLAAQAGVRYSLENPHVYATTNVVGFLNILEACRRNPVEHLVYASSSSIYGLNDKVPFSEKDPADHPVSLYAATKRANELMAHSYSTLYQLPVTGLRFFTVYGPWGRPDMAPFLFTDAIYNNRPIKVFNEGRMWRDFTYIDDTVAGILCVIDTAATPNAAWDAASPLPDSSPAPFRIYNIGNSRPVQLMDFITAIEQATGKTAKKIYLPMQPGDVYQTNADTHSFEQQFHYQSQTDIHKGIEQFVCWYQSFYGRKS